MNIDRLLKQEEERLLTQEEAAHLLGIKATTLQTWRC